MVPICPICPIYSNYPPPPPRCLSAHTLLCADGLSKEVGEKAAAMIARTTEGRTSFVSLRFTNIVKRELFGSLPWPAPPLPPPAVPSEVSASNRPLPLVFWAWTHEDDVIEAHMLAAAAPNDRLFADPKRQAYTSFLIAAPSTRFAEPTEDLLVGHFGADRAATIVRKHPLVGNTSVRGEHAATTDTAPMAAAPAAVAAAAHRLLGNANAGPSSLILRLKLLYKCPL